MRSARKIISVAVASAALLGAGAPAQAASLYAASATTLTGTLMGGPIVFVTGNVVVKCTISSLSVSGLATGYSALPAAFGGLPALRLSACSATQGGIARTVAVRTGGTWSFNLSTLNYLGTLNVPANGVEFVVNSTCTITSLPSNLAVSLRNAVNVIPALGSPATRLALNGTMNVTTSSSCPVASTASVVADGSFVSGGTTGTYQLNGTLTEI